MIRHKRHGILSETSFDKCLYLIQNCVSGRIRPSLQDMDNLLQLANRPQGYESGRAGNPWVAEESSLGWLFSDRWMAHVLSKA